MLCEFVPNPLLPFTDTKIGMIVLNLFNLCKALETMKYVADTVSKSSEKI